MNKHKLEFVLDKYIAQPYWPEQSELISIQKHSGFNRCKSEAKRQAALVGYLTTIGKDLDYHKELQRRASAKWHRQVAGDDSTPIIIPPYHFLSMLVAAEDEAPSSIKLKTPIRSALDATNSVSDKTKTDGKFERFVKMETSNERRFASDEYITEATFQTTLIFDPDYTSTKKVSDLLTFGLSKVGIGACRKMGFGRGRLISLEPIK